MKIIQITAANEELFALTDDGRVLRLVGIAEDLHWALLPTPFSPNGAATPIETPASID